MPLARRQDETTSVNVTTQLLRYLPCSSNNPRTRNSFVYYSSYMVINPAVTLHPVVSSLFSHQTPLWLFLLDPVFWTYKNDYQLLSPHCLPGTVRGYFYTLSHLTFLTML